MQQRLDGVPVRGARYGAQGRALTTGGRGSAQPLGGSTGTLSDPTQPLSGSTGTLSDPARPLGGSTRL
ncbi:hypothetical protein ABZ626_30875 [Streptomyces longispororuber]|uniref:hypothetical protein n=1 Tax=Streptomyces longispororuber TaxID=68230 RepID=UPI0033D55BBF